jgi:hypothetical protein
MFEPAPQLREVILEPVYLKSVVLDDIDGQPLLDETGNFIRDEDGNVIHGQE